MRLGWGPTVAIAAVLVWAAVSCSSGEPEVVPAPRAPAPSEAPPTEDSSPAEAQNALASCGSTEIPEGGAKVSEQEAIEIAFGHRAGTSCDQIQTRYYWIKNHPRWRVVVTPRREQGCTAFKSVDAISGKVLGGGGGCP